MKAIVLFLLLSTEAAALTLKIGVLAPDGSSWAKTLKKMAAEMKSATKGALKMKFYFGGSQGDESDVLKKVRIGQLHGGVFTGKTLGDINGDVRLLELPFTFYHDHKKAHKALAHMTPHLNAGIEKGKLKNLGFFGMGMVYFVSQKKTPDLAGLHGVKIWFWEGDKIVAAMIDLLNLVAVPIPLPDVLNSLQTGILQAAYAPPLGIVALQWDSKVNYLVDFPIAFSVGAFLLSQKSWKRMKPAHQGIVQKIAAKYMEQLNRDNGKDNADALAVMRQKGIEFLAFPVSEQKRGKEIRRQIVKRLTGKVFSKRGLKRLHEVVGTD